MPTVSVIIPNYNHASFLKQRINSVLYQTFQDFEIIILDDCSHDNSRDIIEEYRLHPKIKCIVYNTINSGSSFKQWKKGIELAESDYVWIAESDDWCEPSFLAEMICAFNENNDLVLAHCQLLCIRNGIIEWRTDSKLLKEISEGNVFNIQNMLGYNGIPNASGVVFKRKCFFHIGDQYLKMLYCGDWFIWSQICRQGKVFTSGKYLNYFNKHEGDVSGNATVNGLDFTEGNLIFLNIIEQEKPSQDSIKTALDHRFKRLNTLKHCYTDPTLYEGIKNNLLQFYLDYHLQSPIVKQGFFERFKTLVKKLSKSYNN